MKSNSGILPAAREAPAPAGDAARLYVDRVHQQQELAYSNGFASGIDQGESAAHSAYPVPQSDSNRDLADFKNDSVGYRDQRE